MPELQNSGKRGDFDGVRGCLVCLETTSMYTAELAKVGLAIAMLERGTRSETVPSEIIALPVAIRCTQDRVNGGVRSVKQLADFVHGIASFSRTLKL